MNVVELIIRKRDGDELTASEIGRLVDDYTRGQVPDYQISAFLMAAFLRGLSPEESVALTEAMLHSGAVLDLSDIAGKKVDKHSTGGVGDKISIALAPVVAAAGVPVPMISGRGLGHTGGTLDKLEAIPGFRTNLSIEEYRRQLDAIGVVMIGQTADIAPADKKLYALRDVTGTVEYIPFIASSIMSKKLAEGIDGLVLDVKWGRGAFMKTEPDARRLAETLEDIGSRYGKPVVAWLTNMNNPLGFAIGNWPETREAIRCLHGDAIPEVSTLVEVLAGEMIWLGDKASSPDEGRRLARRAIDSGEALEKLCQLVQWQGGDPKVVERPDEVGQDSTDIVHASDRCRGVVRGIDPYALGRAAVDLGAGRKTVGDPVDPMAGIVLLKKPGDEVQPGEPIARLQTTRRDQIDAVVRRVEAAFEFEDAQRGRLGGDATGQSPAGNGEEAKAWGRPLLTGRYESGRWTDAVTPG